MYVMCSSCGLCLCVCVCVCVCVDDGSQGLGVRLELVPHLLYHVLLHMPLHRSSHIAKYFQRTDPSVLFALLFMFTLSLIMFNFLVSVFFSRAKVAAIVGPILLFVCTFREGC